MTDGPSGPFTCPTRIEWTKYEDLPFSIGRIGGRWIDCRLFGRQLIDHSAANWRNTGAIPAATASPSSSTTTSAAPAIGDDTSG